PRRSAGDLPPEFARDGRTGEPGRGDTPSPGPESGRTGAVSPPARSLLRPAVRPGLLRLSAAGLLPAVLRSRRRLLLAISKRTTWKPHPSFCLGEVFLGRSKRKSTQSHRWISIRPRRAGTGRPACFFSARVCPGP